MAAESPNWISRFREENAIWQLMDNKNPHVKTSMSGDHVNAYFNSDLIASQPKLIEEIIGTSLVPALRQSIHPDWVFSYAPYGLFVASEAARQLQARCGYTKPTDGYETDFPIASGDTALVVADDIYSGGGVLRTIETLEAHGVIVVPVIFCLANLSGSDQLGNRQLAAAATLPAMRYASSDCKLCQDGSKALLSRPHWAELQTGKK